MRLSFSNLAGLAMVACPVMIGFAPVAAQIPPVDSGTTDPRPQPPFKVLRATNGWRAMPPGEGGTIAVRDFSCPRIDIVSIGKNVSALNLNGYTVGHFRNTKLRLKDGANEKFNSGQMAFLPSQGEDQPRLQCSKSNIIEMSVDPISHQITIGDRVVGVFEKFTATRAVEQNDSLARMQLRRRGVKTTKFGIGKRIDIVAQNSGSIGGGSGGLPGLGGPSPDPPKHIVCHPGQGRWCPD